jgi:[acyl-carrier-protein] S-malonyltransferase
MSYAILFPGQGSQFRGMGADLFDRRPDLLVETADAVLGWSLREMCLEADEEDLTRTEHAQPALFALSYVLWEEALAGFEHPPAAAAGHSLGEYTALAAAGAISFAQGLAVVAERGRAMAGAADQEDSGMAALLGAEVAQAEAVTLARRQSGGRLFVANINAPGQVVVAGAKDDLEWLEAEAANHGIRKVARLKVAGAFHSPFMSAAAERVEAALAGVEFAEPQFEVWSNVTAEPHVFGREKQLLARQVTSPVRFAETLASLANAGIDCFVHVGPGDVTLGMAKRSAPGAIYLALSELSSIPLVRESIVSIAG